MKPWRVCLGHGSFVTLEFDKPDAREPTHGEWHLWIYCCDWRLTRGKAVVAKSAFSNRDEVNTALAALEANTVDDAQISGNNTSLVFTDGLRISVWPYEDSVDWPAATTEQWLLFRPSGDVVALFADGHVEIRPR